MTLLADNRLLELLGCTVPVVLAGMGGVSRAELVAAVTEAGGFGFLGMVREPPQLIAREVGQLRALGHTKFGVNIVPAATDPVLLEQQVVTCIQLAVPVVGTFWDLDERLTGRLRDAGIVVVHQVGTVDEALAAERAGVDLIIAQGREAGGHVRGVRPLRDLLPEVASAVAVPVLAAGGLVTGADLVVARALGAAGIVLGTAMLATEEAFAHAYHKQRLLVAQASDTVLNSSFHINWPPGAPVRTLKSAVTAGARGDPRTRDKVVIGTEEGRPIYLFSTDSPLRNMHGDFESMALYAGTGVGRLDEITPARDRVQAVLAEAEAMIAGEDAARDTAELSSPACYAHEMSGIYMGSLSSQELAAELLLLASEMRLALRSAQHRSATPPTSSEAPFAAMDGEYASWSLRLEALASHAGKPSPAGRPLPALHQEPDLSLLHGTMLRRLTSIMPRLPDQHLGEQLWPLLAFLRSGGAAQAIPATEADRIPAH